MYFKKLYKRLVNDTYRTIYSEKARAEIRFRYVLKILVLFLSIVSVINYANNKITMGNIALSLTILYFICYWIVYFFKGKGTLIVTVIMNVHFFLVATYVIILGASDGISVVWIVLSPPVCVLLIGLKYGSVSVFAIIAELIFFFWTPFGNELVKYDYHPGFKTIFPMVIIVLYIFTFFFEFMREITIKALHRERSRIEEVYKYQHKELEGRIQETRRARHDMRHYLLVLNSLIEGGKSDRAKAYIEERMESVEKSSMVTYCEHFGINAVMTYFDARAKEYGIKTDIKLSYPEEMHISQTDLTVIFANFLENAFDACRYGVEHDKAFKPYIQVKGVYDNGQIITHIKNNMIGKAVVNENNKFMSSKHPGEGVGIDSVRAIVEKYGGILNIEQGSGEFNVYLIV